MTGSFEHRSLESLNIGLIHKKAKGKLEGGRLREQEFVGEYGERAIADDLKEVAEIERRAVRFRVQEGKMIAEIFEALVSECGESNNWFGKNALVRTASRFDDFKNGIDAIVEFPESEGSTFLGLAADVTFSPDIAGKFARIQEQIGKGQLARVKYFKPVHELPEVIVGAGMKIVLEVGELWLEQRNRELEVHRLQVMLLIQMRAQLEAFALLARAKKHEHLIPHFVGALIRVEAILKEKEPLVKQVLHLLEDDPVHRQILSTVRSISAQAKVEIRRNERPVN